MIKLNIGGGKGHPKIQGWTIIDIREQADIKIDISHQKLPFEANYVDIIYCSHTLEHIYRHDLKFVLDEFYRVLKPNTGIIRICVPDIKKACFHYLINNRQFFIKSKITNNDNNNPIGGLLSDWFYSFRSDDLGNGHVHCFDSNYMKLWLASSGFIKIKKMRYRKSFLKELEIEGLDLYESDSLFLEAMKA